MNPHKICQKCDEDKELEQFHRNRRAKDGRKNVCAVCCHAAVRHDYPPVEDPMKLHRCPVCGGDFPMTLEYFHANRCSRSGLQTECKKCQYARNTKYRGTPQHKQSLWKSHLKRKYGISVEEYQILVERQQGLCAICGEFKNLHIDHNHVTTRVRGLLCGDCNRALGLFHDNAQRLQSAIDYLTANSEEP